MTTEGTEPGELLFERLQQAASGDAAMRQLRRRYDLLRRDYEHLVDRLGEIEDRLQRPAARRPEPPPTPPPAPPAVPTSGNGGDKSVREGLVAPLLRLRDEYLAAAGAIEAIVNGLDVLAAAAFKGESRSPSPPAPSPGASQARPAGRPARMQVEVKGSGFGELLDFQERLSDIAGVARVSINAIDHERATLVVELEQPDA